jgi:ubiquinone/menaquinone biosynthesis C-methylase UbiE
MKKSRFDIIAESYGKAIAAYPRARSDHLKILEWLNLSGGEKILEIAAGSGFLTEKIAFLLTTGRLIAYDISGRMIDISKKKIKKLKLERVVEYYVSEDKTLPKVKNQSLDKAVCLGGFHHIEDPISLFRTIHKKLKPGGQFIVGDFADDSPVQRYFDERINRLTSTGHQAMFLSISQMENFARFSGLQAIGIERVMVPFIFPTEADAGIFFQTVHCLDQILEECILDIKSYMGISPAIGKVVVPMDYIYARYKKGEE